MKMFCTGSAGFIGSHLVDTLLKEGHHVTGFDNFFTGRRKDIEPFAENENFNFIFGDVRNLSALTRAMAGCDVVWHLAASGNIPAGVADTNLDFDINTCGTRNVLEAMRANKIRHILFSSTAAVYGDGAASGIPLAETFGPLIPISLYAASKLAGEAMISAYCHLFGMRAHIFRFANVVGSKMGHGLLFDTIQKLLKSPTRIEAWGDGISGAKPFVLIDDLIWGMVVAYRHCDKQCDVYNLGVSDTTKISDAIAIVIEEMGLSNVQVDWTGGARGFPGDVPVVIFNPSKMAQYGWKAQYKSTEAVRIAVKRLLEE